MTIGERIRERRRELRMTQNDLAQAIGVTYQLISNYEHSVVSDIPMSRIKQMARVLQCDPLSGVCVCGSCGRRIYSMNSKGKGYYLCRTPGCIAHRAEIIDEQVLEILSEKLRPTSDLKARIFELYERRINSGAETQKAKKQNIITRQRISRLMESLQMTDDLEVRKMILDELTRARAQVVPEPEVKQADRQAIDDMVDQFFDIRNKDPQEQKQIILRAGIEVVINQDHSVLIRYQTGNCLLSFTIDGGISAQ